MDIRQLFGEISNKEVIGTGDTIIVKYYENGKEKTDTGVLVFASKTKVTINGTTPKKDIEVKDIIQIKKVQSMCKS